MLPEGFQKNEYLLMVYIYRTYLNFIRSEIQDKQTVLQKDDAYYISFFQKSYEQLLSNLNNP